MTDSTEKEGCFVFQVLGTPIRARSKPTTAPEDRTRLEFQPGEMLSADLIQGPQTSSSTTFFCRLTDKTGWVFDTYNGERCLEPLETEIGLWAFYVEATSGQFLRRHPVDSEDLSYATHFKYMHKVYADRRVTHPSSGVTYYRVQGSQGWLADRLPEGRSLLVSCDHVQVGFFAYRALADLAIRGLPSASLEYATRKTVPKGETIMCDMIRKDSGEGLFMKLVDGSGWVFEQMHGTKMLESVAVRKGTWEFRVQNPPVGVGLRSTTSDSQSNLTGQIYPPGCTIQCDRAITGARGVVFYRVCGTGGWVFDRRGDTLMIELLASSESRTKSNHSLDSWQPDFVRGIVATVPTAIETSYDATTQTLAVETQRSQVHIYCQTRMIGILSPGQHYQKCHKYCDVSDLMASLRDEPLGSDEEKKAEETNESMDEPEEVEKVVREQEELQVRKELLQCEHEISLMKNQQMNLLQSIQAYEKMRLSPEAQAQLPLSTPNSLDDRKRGLQRNSPFPELGIPRIPRSSRSNSYEAHSSGRRTPASDPGIVQEKFDFQTDAKAIVTKVPQHMVSRLDTKQTLAAPQPPSFTESQRSCEAHPTSTRSQSSTKMDGIQDAPCHMFSTPVYTIPSNAATSKGASSCRPQGPTGGRKVGNGGRPRRHGRGLFSCGECNDRFESIESRDLHCAMVHKTQCNICRRVFKSHAALAQHEATEHA